MSKHRRLELTHFCLQYYEWAEESRNLRLYPETMFDRVHGSDPADPVFDISERLLEIEAKMEMVRLTALKTDPYIGEHIFEAVTENKAFPYFEANGIPCGKDMFYDRLRKFFWLLDKVRK